MADTATLTSNFEISIPESVRASNDWSVGQKFVFLPKGTGVLLVPVPSQDELAGIATGANTDDYRDRNDRF